MQQEMEGALEQLQKDAEDQRSGALAWPMPVQAHTLKRGMKLYSLSVLAEMIFTGKELGYNQARTGVEQLEIMEYVVDTVHHPEEFPNVVMIGTAVNSLPLTVIKQNGYIPGFYEDRRALEIYQGWMRLPKKDEKSFDPTEDFSRRHISLVDKPAPQTSDDIANYGPGVVIDPQAPAPEKKTYVGDGASMTFTFPTEYSPVMSADPKLFLKHDGAYLGERVITRADGFMYSTAALEVGNSLNIFDMVEAGPEGSVQIHSIEIPVLWVLSGGEVQRIETLPENLTYTPPLDPKAPHNKDMDYGLVRTREGKDLLFNLNKVTGFFYCFPGQDCRVIAYELVAKCSPKT